MPHEKGRFSRFPALSSANSARRGRGSACAARREPSTAREVRVRASCVETETAASECLQRAASPGGTACGLDTVDLSVVVDPIVVADESVDCDGDGDVVSGTT